MKEALGLVETRGLSTAILVADVMVKTANVNIIELENTRGLGYMTIKISGDVGAVNAAVTAGKQIAIENNAFVSAKVIPRPSNNIEIAFCQLRNKGDTSVTKDNSIVEENNNLESTIVTAQEVLSETIEKPENNQEEIISQNEEVVIESEEVTIQQNKSDTEISQPEGKKTKRSSRKKVETKKE